MKYIKKFESRESKTFDKDDLEVIFATSSDDASSNYPWHNDFAKSSKGYIIKYAHNFYDTATLEDFNKFYNLIDSIKMDMDRFIDEYNPSFIGFQESGNSEINIIIKP